MVEKYVQHHIVSWDKLHRDSKKLAELLIDFDFKGLIAITRGGLVPAAIIARELDIRLVDTICISSYNEKEQKKELTVLKTVLGDGEGFVLIDDLVDTGKTAKYVRELLPKAYFATVYGKPEGLPAVDTYITEVSQDTWIVFPWDSEIQYIKPLAKTK